MNRRVFIMRFAAVSAGFLSIRKGKAAWAKDLPSDIGANPGGAPGPAILPLTPFEKSGGFALEKALLDRKSIKSYDPGRKRSLEEILDIKEDQVLRIAQAVGRA